MTTILNTTYANSKAGAEQLALDAMVADYGSDAVAPVSVCHTGAVGEFLVRFAGGVEWVVCPTRKTWVVC